MSINLSAGATKPPAFPLANYTKQVRFAVVMYGGVSLAIYINGVTQELLHMVRSTSEGATDAKDQAVPLKGSALPDGLNGTGRVYRKLSYLLSDDVLLAECRELLNGADLNQRNTRFREKLDALINNNADINTAFIVDILSGTSAGGINAIYLGKALANDQSMDRLKELWISEGDISLLLNDKRSVSGLNLNSQDPPQSLLNSRRMYMKLLNALEDMDGTNTAGKKRSSPHVDELDLFITTTDIEGVPVALRLSDMIVYERRHRNVFHFKYARGDKPETDFNDFERSLNPFLAFAARCTSSFPFAFEPMRLCDIDEILKLSARYRDQVDCKSDSPKWRRFFKDVSDPSAGQPNLRVEMRSFGDGGYLDNKPFSYAIDTLVRRHSDVPVDRKLIYIEPSPEHPEDQPELDYKPDALANVKAALLDLPPYETIREDLQKVLERNQLIERVRRIISGTERDVHTNLLADLEEPFSDRKVETEKKDSSGRGQPENANGSKGQFWSERTLTQMVKQYGRYYLPYRHLRVSSVTDDLARLVARLANFDENSDLFLAVRCLIRAWRETTYKDNGKPSVNAFLWYYDFQYRLRRLSFLRNKLDQLYLFDKQLLNDLKTFEKINIDVKLQLRANDTTLGQAEAQTPELVLQSCGAELSAHLSLIKTKGMEKELRRFRKALLLTKGEINNVYNDLRVRGRELNSRRMAAKLDPQNEKGELPAPLFESVKNIGLTAEHLTQILGAAPNGLGAARNNTSSATEEDVFQRAKDFLDRKGTIRERFGETAELLKEELSAVLQGARKDCVGLFNPMIGFPTKSLRGLALQASDKSEDWSELMNLAPVRALRRYLGYYYNNFDDYDQISFPIFYEASVGEADLIEVIRISPEDATTLIDERAERKNSSDGVGRQKLAGTALHHFGAFLDRVWRKNDIMWGRLDGAERLLAALLPGAENDKVRTALIEEAHEAILFEEMSEESRLQLGGLMTEAIVRAGSGEPIEEAIGKVLGNLDSSPIKTGLESVIRTSLGNQELLEFVRKSYKVNRRLDPQMLLRALSRSTQIVGKVFEDIANKNQLDGKSLAWIARLGQMFWGLVEVAVPNSIANLLLKRWLQVIYVFEFFLIVGGILLSRPGAQQFGWTAFGITAILNIIILMLKDRMQNRRGVLYATGLVIGITFLFLAALGALDVSGAVFNVKVGELHPREWLRQNIQAILPQGGWWVYLPAGLFIAIALLLVVALNLISAHNFRWLSMRVSLWKKWLMQSPLAALIPGGKFKPIKLDNNKLKAGIRSYPGPDEQLYLLPFHLSAEPPVEWTRIFHQQFKEAAEDEGAGVQTTVYNDQCWLIAPALRIRALHSRLKVALDRANQKYEVVAREEARESYLNHKRLVQSLKELPSSDLLYPEIKGTLQHLAEDATKLSRLLSRGGRIVGVLTALTGLAILLFVGANYVRDPNANVVLPAGLHMPGLALELVRTPAEVDQIINATATLNENSSPSLATQSLVSNIKMDYWFIAWYALVLGSLSIWLFKRAYSNKARNLVIAAGFLIPVAAIFDVLENIRMLRVLTEGLRTQQAIDAIRFAGTMKWASLFVSIGLLAWLFIPRKDKAAIIGYLLLSTALLGLIGLVYAGAIEAAFLMMGLSMFVLGAVVLITPRRLVLE
ncbi:MAG: hypothetical protein QOF62_1194 [Pyrinomonadaceae bacterium]|jgi:patatin-related protein|nr:hypothetical protein [Pyrinomonadaceae bacterium]